MQISKRNVVKIGNSWYISIPPDWLREHHIDPEDLQLLTVVGEDIRIINPRHEQEVEEKISKLAEVEQ